MSTGNYDHDNFVRVDCAASPEQFRINAVHETAHFTLVKQSFFGLLCFFLRQDTRDARSPLMPGLRTLEQAFECTNECYARLKELLLCTPFPAAGPQVREALLVARRTQPYFVRYHMERLEPILLQYGLAVRCPLFPDRLFLMAAEVDTAPLLDCGFQNLRCLQSLILSRPEALYPDHRLARLLQAFSLLLRRLWVHGCPAPTAENLETSFHLSLSDAVIPAALESRFPFRQNSQPVFRLERNVLCIFLEPEVLLSPELLTRQGLRPGPRSALLRFTDTHAGLTFSDAYLADLSEARPLLDTYPGTVFLYLDDYERYRRLGSFRLAPVFFRADVPWNHLGSELALQGFRIARAFLQRYSDSVFFFFGFDAQENVVFSMLAQWEMEKIHAALADGVFSSCGPSDTDRYGPNPWYAFRDIMSAITEDRVFGRMDSGTFRRLRLL